MIASIKKISVAVLNDEDDFLDAIEIGLKMSGCDVSTKYSRNLMNRKEEFLGYVHKHCPNVMIMEMPPPYERLLKFFHEIRRESEDAGVRFLLLSSNAQKLRENFDPRDPIEICAMPFDLDHLAGSIRRIIS